MTGEKMQGLTTYATRKGAVFCCLNLFIIYNQAHVIGLMDAINDIQYAVIVNER